MPHVRTHTLNDHPRSFPRSLFIACTCTQCPTGAVEGGPDEPRRAPGTAQAHLLLAARVPAQDQGQRSWQGVCIQMDGCVMMFDGRGVLAYAPIICSLVQEGFKAPKPNPSINFQVAHTITAYRPNSNTQPDKRPKSPMSGESLRAKDLIPLSLMVDPEWTVRVWFIGRV